MSPALERRSPMIPALATALLLMAATTGAAQTMPIEARTEALQSVVQIAPYDWEAGRFFGSSGSGTVISALGHVLTNLHVVLDDQGNPTEAMPIFTTDAKAPTEAAQLAHLAVLVAADADLDLALLQIVTDAQGEPLPADHRFTFAPIGTIENLLLGDSVFVIGFPGVSGNTITFTGGVVSGFLGPDAVGSGNAWVKTDARMAPGNSGGGAFDAAGTLVGVPTMLLRDSLPGLHQELFRPINYAYAMISQHVPAPALQVGARPPQQPPATPSEVAKGAADVIRGSLGLADPPYFAERRAHAFHVSIQQPGLVSISLKSADFDAYLVLLAPSGSVLLEVDDSLGVGPNVAEDVRIDVPGTYTIIVTTTLPHEAGAYALTVTSPDGAGPLSVTATNLPRENVGGYAPTYAGRWSGRIIDTAGGRGAVVAELTQTGAAIVEGTWEATFTWGTTSGTIMGLIQSEGLFVELYPHDRTACPFSGLAELDGYTIAGAYTAFDCTIPIAGSISLTQRP